MTHIYGQKTAKSADKRKRKKGLSRLSAGQPLFGLNSGSGKRFAQPDANLPGQPGVEQLANDRTDMQQ